MSYNHNPYSEMFNEYTGFFFIEKEEFKILKKPQHKNSSLK